jgi:hypothetical protein
MRRLKANNKINYADKHPFVSAAKKFLSDFVRVVPFPTTMIYLRFFKSNFFTLNGVSRKYVYRFYPCTFRTERALEVPIAIDFINGDCLEVGNVLHLYDSFKHDVVDKFEKGAINEDIADFHTIKKYDSIICISTLEHIGWDGISSSEHATWNEEKEKAKALQAIVNMKSFLKDNGKMLVTFPYGYNKALDKLIETNKFDFTTCLFLKRVSMYKWEETNFAGVKDSLYNSPYPMANALVIGVYDKMLQGKK